MSGRIEIICGPMFSGKTEELIRRLKRLKYANQTYLLFKPSTDVRYSETEVLTHDMVGLKSVPVDSAGEILEIIDLNKDKKIDVIAIDEGQFFSIKDNPSLVQVVTLLKENGYRVIVNGLDMDFMGKPFVNMPELLAIADSISKLTSVCCICGNEGTMTYRTNSSSEQLELGSFDKYQARCFKHWKEGMDENWRKK